MKTRTFMIGGLCAVILGLILTGCKKEKPVAQLDPHSPEAVNLDIQHQQTVLSEALKKEDFVFIHRKMYYIESLADALSHKLAGQEKKQRVDAIIVNLKKLTEQIDRSGGSKHREATEAMLTQLFAIFKELDAEFVTKTDKK